MSKADNYISSEAIHHSPPAVPVPSKTALYKLPKGGIVEEALKLGIELNMDLTKDQMVAALMDRAKNDALEIRQMNETRDPRRILDLYVDSITR